MPTRELNKGGGVDGIYGGDEEERFFVGKKVMLKEVREEEEEEGKIGLVKNICCSDESSSSIGKNSDISEEKSGDGEEEVQSSYKGPLASMEALEEVLPMRRGISRFYKGKSKSFASLGDAASSPSIAKPENAYMRKRRNMVAASGSPLSLRGCGGGGGGGIAKRVTSSGSSRAALALAVAITNPPTKDLSSWSLRSFSLADFQQLR